MDKALKDQLAKLLTLKKGTTFENEAENVAAAISRLLLKHNLDASVLDDITLNTDMFDYIRHNFEMGVSTGDSFVWKLQLLNVVSRAHFVKVLRFIKGRKIYHTYVLNQKKGYAQLRAQKIKQYSSSVQLIGQPDNIEVVKMLYTYLEKEISKYSRNAWKESGLYNILIDKARTERNWKKSYRVGFIQRLETRFLQARQSEIDESIIPNSCALVVQLEKNLQDAYDELLKDETLVNVKSRKSFIFASAYYSGIDDADKVSLDKKVAPKRVALK